MEEIDEESEVFKMGVVDISNESILTSIKKIIGITEEYDQFDTDIIMHINSVFMTLSQLGVGDNKGFFITSKDNKWNEFLEEGLLLNHIKTYIYLKVKLLFDPPSNTNTLESTTRMIKECEWRINTQAEYYKYDGIVKEGME